MRRQARESFFPNAPNPSLEILIPKPKFKRFTRLRWLMMVIFLLIVGCADRSAVPAVSTSLVIPTPSNVGPESQTPTASATETSVRPTATLATTPLPVDLRLGIIERDMNCPLITKVVALVLEQEMSLNVEVKELKTVDHLFTSLTNRDIDLTLCYIDPDDRAKMQGTLGTIRQIGIHYWDDGQSKLQIWANGTFKANLREQMPCVLRFLEEFELSENTFEESEAETWIQNHANEVQTWISCVP